MNEQMRRAAKVGDWATVARGMTDDTLRACIEGITERIAEQRCKRRKALKRTLRAYRAEQLHRTRRALALLRR
jgi:hypothetical protein